MRILTISMPIAIFWALLSSGCASNARQGNVGESCRARNDCSRDLACVRNTCVPGGLGLSATGRECYVVECSEDADCCSDFVPDSNCSVYEETCQSNPSLCLAFFSLCVCNRNCVDDQCYEDAPACTVDDHCAFASRPFCQSERCVACREHADCQGGSERCVEGACVAGCERDEQCSLLEACTEGTCVPRGCASDRECVLLLADGRSVCRDGGCAISCSEDWECDEAALEVCHEGSCVFAGCTTDAECRIVLDVANELSENVRAECR